MVILQPPVRVKTSSQRTSLGKFANAENGMVVYPNSLCFKAGKYDDKGVTITDNDLMLLVRSTKLPIQLNLEHISTEDNNFATSILAGELGLIRSMWIDPNDKSVVRGEIVMPKRIADKLSKRGLSMEFYSTDGKPDVDTGFVGAAITYCPRIAQAQMMSTQPLLLDFANKGYKVPETVKKSAKEGLHLYSVYRRGNKSAVKIAKLLSTNEYVPEWVIKKLEGWLTTYRPANFDNKTSGAYITLMLMGGLAGRKWAKRTLNVKEQDMSEQEFATIAAKFGLGVDGSAMSKEQVQAMFQEMAKKKPAKSDDDGDDDDDKDDDKDSKDDEDEEQDTKQYAKGKKMSDPLAAIKSQIHELGKLVGLHKESTPVIFEETKRLVEAPDNSQAINEMKEKLENLLKEKETRFSVENANAVDSLIASFVIPPANRETAIALRAKDPETFDRMFFSKDEKQPNKSVVADPNRQGDATKGLDVNTNDADARVVRNKIGGFLRF